MHADPTLRAPQHGDRLFQRGMHHRAEGGALHLDRAEADHQPLKQSLLLVLIRVMNASATGSRFRSLMGTAFTYVPFRLFKSRIIGSEPAVRISARWRDIASSVKASELDESRPMEKSSSVKSNDFPLDGPARAINRAFIDSASSYWHSQRQYQTSIR